MAITCPRIFLIQPAQPFLGRRLLCSIARECSWAIPTPPAKLQELLAAGVKRPSCLPISTVYFLHRWATRIISSRGHKATLSFTRSGRSMWTSLTRPSRPLRSKPACLQRDSASCAQIVFANVACPNLAQRTSWRHWPIGRCSEMPIGISAITKRWLITIPSWPMRWRGSGGTSCEKGRTGHFSRKARISPIPPGGGWAAWRWITRGIWHSALVLPLARSTHNSATQDDWRVIP